MDLRTILTVVAILLFFASAFFLIKAIRKHDNGTASMWLITLFASVITIYFSLPNGISSVPMLSSVGNPGLEINDQIEKIDAGRVCFRFVTVRNRGTGSAINCTVEIEHREPNEQTYSFLGYSYNKEAELLGQTQTKFNFIRANANEEATSWTTYIMLREIRDYVEKNSIPLNPLAMTVGDHYFRLTAVADNGKSAPREFKLHVKQDEPPILEIILEPGK